MWLYVYVSRGGGAQRDYVILTVIRVEGGVIRGDALARQHAAVLS